MTTSSNPTSASEPRQAPIPTLPGSPYPKGENAVAYIGQVQQGLRKAGATDGQVEAVMDDMMSGDYDHLYDAYRRLF
ncbi:MAG: hypothetical protein DRP42_05080 [Tenericutes bacterium]|nr:MAG: hypothetical protein DRP42_05080 [Mycoplasmatota bacterium]